MLKKLEKEQIKSKASRSREVGAEKNAIGKRKTREKNHENKRDTNYQNED